ncbi:hypothetical protein IH781_00325, partial [Patescibacteria group bacterium]|nr:hypothetical protein [Patescibacteria group bacterium]
ERDSTFAELREEATTTLYNVTDTVKSVRLQFTIAPESHGNLQIRTKEGLLTTLTASPGETVSVLLELAPGQTQLFWQNELTEKVILQNPRLDVFD